MYAIRYAYDNDLDRLQHFWTMANVPYHQVNQHAHFLFIEEVDKKKIVGTVGLEVYQSAGMLRAFVIDPSSKDAHLSLMLIDLMLAYAKKLSLQKIYLIAKKGSRFFEKRGFQKTSLDLLPIKMMNSKHIKGTKGQGIPMVYEI